MVLLVLPMSPAYQNRVFRIDEFYSFTLEVLTKPLSDYTLAREVEIDVEAGCILGFPIGRTDTISIAK
jgi:hypothetical protein